MGSGIWRTDVYDAAKRDRARTGADPFSFSRSTAGRASTDRRVHDKLNPLKVTRESRDSAEHPNAHAIAIMMDVTGSMSTLPGLMLDRLPQLHGLLQRKGYVADPQVLFGAIGDATCDRAPLQVGQFESDNRQEDDIMRLYLEGGGGGQKTESYELALYFMAHHTSIDCWEKRGRRGYLFLVGDELPYPNIKPDEVGRLIGDHLWQPQSTAAVMRDLERRYHVYFLLPRGASHGGDREVLDGWRQLLGQRVIELDDPAEICETIALTIGLTEGSTTLADGLNDLRDLGASDSVVNDIDQALQRLPTASGAGRSTTPTLRLPAGLTWPPRTRRLT